MAKGWTEKHPWAFQQNIAMILAPANVIEWQRIQVVAPPREMTLPEPLNRGVSMALEMRGDNPN